jgi:hypothetical protein
MILTSLAASYFRYSFFLQALKLIFLLAGNGTCKPPMGAADNAYYKKCNINDSEIFIKATGAPTVKITGGKIIIDFGFSADLVASRNCSACTVRGASVHITPC